MVISRNGVKSWPRLQTRVWGSVKNEVAQINNITMVNKVGEEKLIIRYLSIRKQLT